MHAGNPLNPALVLRGESSTDEGGCQLSRKPHLDAIHERTRRVTLLTSAVLTVILLLWATTPAKPFFAGMFLGGLVSLYNILHIARKLRQVGERMLTGDGRRSGIGMASRFLMLVLPVALAIRYPEWVDARSIFLGLPIGYAVAVVVEYRRQARGKNIGERGENDGWN
ncbi:ATP synthase subunit I [Paludifilum halophilum]|nr:ATP synthase subunit I [Paludifilum halophilum]